MVRANGFEQGMGYGGQDREFGERIANLGLHGLRVRHRAVVAHLDHPRPYKKMESIRRNRALRRASREGGVVRARDGIDELEPEPEEFIEAGPTAKGVI